MSQTNYIVLSGYVTTEPKLGFTKVTRTPITRIRVGSTPRRLDRATGEWRDGETSYFNVTCWRKLAENVTGSLRKGDMVLVRGKFRTRTWVDDQQRTRVEIDIEADSVGHDMSFGWSRFNRGVHVPAPAVQGVADGEAIRKRMAPDGDLDDDFPEGMDEYGNLPGDDGYDSGPEAGLALDAPDDPPTPQGAPRYADEGESPDDDRAFAELTRNLNQPAEEPAAL